MKKSGYTLIELLVAISIIGIILALALPNFLNSRERARDSRRKSEMQALKVGLRLYNQDYAVYPAAYSAFPVFNSIRGCGVGGIENCPKATCGVDFAAGPSTGCEIIYMKKFPSELGSNTMQYYQIAGGDDFCLTVPLESVSDADIATSQSRCAVACSGKMSASSYVVCSD